MISSPPHSSTVVPTSASTSPESVTSALRTRCSPSASPAASDPTLVAASSSTSEMTTRAPSSANLKAMARPIPEPAPVTMALFPLRRSISLPKTSLYRWSGQYNDARTGGANAPLAGKGAALNPYARWIQDLPQVDTPFEGLEGRMISGPDGEAATYEPGETYDIPSGAEHTAILEAGTCVIDVFQDPDRYNPK